MPEAALLPGAIGMCTVGLAFVGLYRRRLVAVWRISRDDQPVRFWLRFAFQLGLGLTCLGSAIQVWAEASAAL